METRRIGPWSHRGYAGGRARRDLVERLMRAYFTDGEPQPPGRDVRGAAISGAQSPELLRALLERGRPAVAADRS
jgi:hypothetical protein